MYINYSNLPPLKKKGNKKAFNRCEKYTKKYCLHHVISCFDSELFGSRESYPHAELHMERHPIPRTLSPVNGPTDWNEALEVISYGSPEQVFYSLSFYTWLFAFLLLEDC